LGYKGLFHAHALQDGPFSPLPLVLKALTVAVEACEWDAVALIRQ
jgi:hypothetical protein